MPSRFSLSQLSGTRIAARSFSKRSHANDDPLPSLLQPHQCAKTATFGRVSDLPIELIDQILYSCDSSTVLRLAAVNRFFNFYITELILTRHRMDLGFTNFRFYNFTQHKLQVLSALNIRLGDKYVVSEFYYSFCSSEDLCRQLAAITQFLQNRVMSMECLKLDFPSANQRTLDEASDSRSRLVRLLKVALTKGCPCIDLNGDIDCFVQHSQPRRDSLFGPTFPPERKPRRERVLSWLSSHLSLSPPPPPPFFDSPPSLNKLRIESCLMWHPSFLSHIFGLLQSQSPTLRNLKVHQPQYSTICEEFFSKVSLPALETFTYTYKRGFPLSDKFNVLYGFLARHPSIQKIKFPPIRANFDAEYPDFDKCPNFDANTLLLPNLKRVYGHAKTISWFLQDPKAFSNLEHVSVEATHEFGFLSLSYIYNDVDDALVALGSRTGDDKSPIHLELKVSVDRFFCWWLSSHIKDPGASPIKNLKMVETLTLCAKDVLAKLEVCHLDKVIAWASLFPNLRCLKLDGYFHDLYEAVRSQPQAFTTSLKDKCPRLERCSVNHLDWVL